MLLQVAFGVADQDVPTLTAVDARRQVVLHCLGAREPAGRVGAGGRHLHPDTAALAAPPLGEHIATVHKIIEQDTEPDLEPSGRNGAARVGVARARKSSWNCTTRASTCSSNTRWGCVSAIQGNKARFRGLEKNQFHLQAVAVVNNCNVLNALFADREAA